MSEFDNVEVCRIASISAEIDLRADMILSEILSPAEMWPSYGVEFKRGPGHLNFSATVHHLKLIARFGHQIERRSEHRVLKGIFRVRLDEPVRSDQTLISWFSFDSDCNAWSPGNIVQRLVRCNGALTIKHDVALLIARDAQRYIEAAQ